MVKGFLTTDDLRELTQYDRVGDIRRCLDKQGIRYFWGKDGVWTTQALVNHAGGLAPPTEADPYPADAFQ